MCAQALSGRCQVGCIHGGKFVPSPETRALEIGGSYAWTVDDLLNGTISGCPLPTKCCTKIKKVIETGWRGAEVEGKTPVLDTFLALTDSGPPGLCMVIDPGPPVLVHQGISGLTTSGRSQARREAAHESGPEPDGDVSTRLRIRLDLGELVNDPDLIPWLPKFVKVFVRLVDNGSDFVFERTVSTDGGVEAQIDLPRTPGKDAWLVVSTSASLRHGLGEFLAKESRPPLVVVPAKLEREVGLRLTVAKRPETWVSCYDDAIRAFGLSGLTWRTLALANGLPGLDARRELPAFITLRAPIKLEAGLRSAFVTLLPAYPKLLRTRLALESLDERVERASRRFDRPGLAERVLLAATCRSLNGVPTDIIRGEFRHPLGFQADFEPIYNIPPLHETFLKLHDQFRRMAAQNLLMGCNGLRNALGGDDFRALIREYEAFLRSAPAVLAFAEPVLGGRRTDQQSALLRSLIQLTATNDAVELINSVGRSIFAAFELISQLEVFVTGITLIEDKAIADWNAWLGLCEQSLFGGLAPEREEIYAPSASPDPARGWKIQKVLIKGLISTTTKKLLPSGKGDTVKTAKRTFFLDLGDVFDVRKVGVPRPWPTWADGPLAIGSLAHESFEYDPRAALYVRHDVPDLLQARKAFAVRLGNFALIPLYVDEIIGAIRKGPGLDPTGMDKLLHLAKIVNGGLGIINVLVDGLEAYYMSRSATLQLPRAVENATMRKFERFRKLQKEYAAVSKWVGRGSKLFGVAGIIESGGELQKDLGKGNYGRAALNGASTGVAILQTVPKRIASKVVPRLFTRYLLRALVLAASWEVSLALLAADLLYEFLKTSKEQDAFLEAIKLCEFGTKGSERAVPNFVKGYPELEVYYDWTDEPGRTVSDLARLREAVAAEAWSYRLLATSRGADRGVLRGLVVRLEPSPGLSQRTRVLFEPDALPPGFRKPLWIRTEVTALDEKREGEVTVSLTLTISSLDPTDKPTDRKTFKPASDSFLFGGHRAEFLEIRNEEPVISLLLARDSDVHLQVDGLVVGPEKHLHLALLPWLPECRPGDPTDPGLPKTSATLKIYATLVDLPEPIAVKSVEHPGSPVYMKRPLPGSARVLFSTIDMPGSSLDTTSPPPQARFR